MRTPVEIHGVRTPHEYREAQRRFRARLRQAPPAEHADTVDAVLDIDVLRVRCSCGDWPVVHPDWRMACCYGCGRIYASVRLPGEPA